MELRRYLALVRRGWWLVLGVPALVLALSLPGFRPDPARYRATAKLVISQSRLAENGAAAGPGFLDFNNYHSWLSSQYLVDDLPGIIKSETFARDLSAWIAHDRNLTIDPPTIQAAFEIDREHRVFSLIITTPSPEQALAIAAGTAALLQEDGIRYWNRHNAGDLAVGVLDLPQTAGALSRWPQPVTRLALRLILGLATGIGLAFLRHYLDRTVHEYRDLAGLDLPLLASIPREP